MPIKLIPSQLRLLNNPSLSLTRLVPMKFTHSFHSPRAAPIFSRVFPFKVKYSGLSVPVLKNGPQQLCLRKLSTRAFRPRSGSEFSRGKDRGEVRVSKSLVEDEAELSDWISDLKPDSFRGRATSDEEDSELNRRRSSVRSKSMDNVSQLKRRREGDSSGFRESNRGRGGRGSFDSSSRGSRGNGSDDSDGERYPRMSNRGGFRGGSSSSSFAMQRGGKDSSFRDRRDSDDNDRRITSGASRGGSSSFAPRRGGGLSRGGRDSSFGSRHDTENKDGELFSRRSDRGSSRGGSSSFATRRGGSSSSGRDSNFVPRRDQGAMGSVKRVPVISDDEDTDADDDEDKNLNNFKYLLGEEDSEDEDTEDNEDDDKEDDEDEDTEDDKDEGEGVSVIKKAATSLFGALAEDSEKKVSVKSLPGQNDSYLSESRFDQCSVSPLSLKGVKDAGYERMTMVQEATLPIILKGKDVLAKAKTGTGKTVAFLLPSIEVVVNSPPVDRDQKRPPICVLVICPTRELASQAASEATKLLKYHPSIGVQVVIGGTRLAMEQKRMQANPCQILVATPGRLKDHIENTAGFATRMMGVKVLILDEADHLLDMGFRKDIERIIAAVPKQRQTLLFSATVPEEVRQICHIALKRDHEFINAVEEGSEDTHAQVRQMHLVAPLDKHFSLLYALLKEHISDDVDYKVLVFCTTAMVTRLVASLLGELNLNVREIHSRKPQSYRTRVSDEFRKSKGLILVTSDVSARGVDYPDVTLVIQVGLPSDREQYIHRLGRTGRKGKEGQGLLMLAPWEEYFLSSIKDLPISKAPVPSVDPDMRKKVERALSQTEMRNKEAAYQAWLGYYNSVKNVGKDKHKLVELANEFSRSMGLDTPPAIPKQVLGKMGLRNIPGLRSK